MDADLLLSRSRLAPLSYAVIDRSDFPSNYPGLFSMYWSSVLQV